MNDVLYQEELLWCQKSRVELIKDGDNNTSYFHLSIITRRWRNRIVAIKNEENHWLYDPQQIKSHIVQYFDHVYTDEPSPDGHDLPRKLFPLFPEYEWKKLTRQYSCNEIYYVVKSMGGLKAPGPDGLQALFFQKHWSLVAPSVCRMALDVLNGKGLPDSLKNTYLVLIPKVDAPKSAKQFRPISLCNVAYKINTKVLV